MGSIELGDVDVDYVGCPANSAPGAIEEARLMAGARAGRQLCLERILYLFGRDAMQCHFVVRSTDNSS